MVRYRLWAACSEWLFGRDKLNQSSWSLNCDSFPSKRGCNVVKIWSTGFLSWQRTGGQVRVQVLEQQLHEARVAAARTLPAMQDNAEEIQSLREETENALSLNQKLEEELLKRDELIEVWLLNPMACHLYLGSYSHIRKRVHPLFLSIYSRPWSPSWVRISNPLTRLIFLPVISEVTSREWEALWATYW